MRCSLEVMEANVTKVFLPGITILFSYNTPVVVTKWEGAGEGKKVYQVNNAQSRTTAKHMNKYGPLANGDDHTNVTAEEIQAIIAAHNIESDN